MKARKSSPNREQGTRQKKCVCECERVVRRDGFSYARVSWKKELFLSLSLLFFSLCVFLASVCPKCAWGVLWVCRKCAWVCPKCAWCVLGCAWVCLGVDKKANFFLRASRGIKVVLCTSRYASQ